MSSIRIPRRLVGVAASVALALGVSGAAFAAVVASSAPASAATTIGPVDPSIPDGNANSLRDVLENQIGSGDTVVLQAGATYTLDLCAEPIPIPKSAGGPHAADGTTGYDDIEIAAAVTIEGNGATIDQTCKDRVLYTEDDITLQDVTVTGGNSSSYGGGLDVDNFGGTTTLTNVTFTGNEAESGGGVGTLGDLTVTGSTFTNNQASKGPGGGIQLGNPSVTATVSGSTFTGNTATGAEDAWGGAIEESGLSKNSVGAAATSPFSITVSGSTFTQNTAASDGGGALDSEDSGTWNISHTTIDGNEGGQGGGIGTFETDSVVNVDHSTLSNNTSHEAGGAILLCCNDSEASAAAASGSSATIVDSTITGNHQASDAAVSVEGAANITYSTVTDNANDATPDGLSAGTHHKVSATAEGTNPATGVVADTITLAGTVLAQPHGAANCSATDGGTITSNGYNFSDDASCNLVGTGDQASAGDPVLGALADNGGPTRTRLPGATSPLLDAIPVAACVINGVTDDQRGISRPQGTGCDVGAVEVAVVPIEIAPKFTG